MTPPEVIHLRNRGALILVAAAWAITLALVAVAAIGWEGRALPILVIGVASNTLPTILVAWGRVDRTARMLIGTLAAIQPALLVFMMHGDTWQMESHMYFFVALAALTILCDWRPIVLASVLIATHHLVLQYAVPAWVFTGSGNLGRVLFHALAVVMQGAMLIYLTVLMRRLMQRQADARIASDDAARIAEARRGDVETAMAASREAERRAAEEREQRAALQQQAETSRQEVLRQLTVAFRDDMTGIVAAVGNAAGELDMLGRSLLDMAQRTTRESADTAGNASQTSASAEMLAARLNELLASITAIAASADQQARHSDNANMISAAGRDAVSALTDRSRAITGFADSIHEIAARTNLLALNATIEAARAGDVGRGFAVVASEVKSLAAQAASATDEIRSLAGSVDDGANIARNALSDIAAMVADLATAAEAIRSAVDLQRETSTAINLSARDTAHGAEAMAQRMVGVASLVGETETLSDRVATAASGLSRTARELDGATQRFIARISAS